MKTSAALFLLPLVLTGQTTQGVISGVVHSAKDEAITSAKVFVYYCRIADDGSIASHKAIRADSKGYYSIPNLTPGQYRLRAVAEGSDEPGEVRDDECFPETAKKPEFQAQEKQDLILDVAGRMEVNFALRPSSEVFDPKAAQYLTPSQAVVRYFAADARTMNSIAVDTAPASQQTGGSTVSYVVSPDYLDRLPLEGRDAYALLTLMPGVTADTATGRGLGYSVNGQRPSSSNFMLDGAENNNYLITGPLTPVAPEAIQEYRISTSNFSAEFGRTSGFLANAITKSGGAAWHGLGYFYMKNDALNAADFQENLARQPRTPLKEAQPGFYVGGPVVRKRLFFSGSFEYYRYRSRMPPQTIDFPTAQFLNAASPQAQSLLERYPSPVQQGPNNAMVAAVCMSPTSTLNRYFGAPKLDYVSKNGDHHVTARLALANSDQPDADWSPYAGFSTPLTQRSENMVINATSKVRANWINEARIGWSSIDLRYEQQRPDIPTLSVPGLSVPGSPSFYSLRDQDNMWQMADSILWSTPKHQVKAGGGVFLRGLNNYLKIASNGYLEFYTMSDFAKDSPSLLIAPVSRQQLYNPAGEALVVPNFDRTYRAADFFGFAQDSIRVSPRFTLDYGVRYEIFGDPMNNGAVKDALVQLGSGNSLVQRIGSGSFVYPPSGDERLYASDPKDWAARLGFAYSIDPTLSIRGGYGIFYDRPYDNLWENMRNNNVVLTTQPLSAGWNYLQALPSQLQSFAGLPVSSIDTNPLFPSATFYQQGLRNGNIQSYFLSLQKQLSTTFLVELNGLSSAGRDLVTTDQVNRIYSLPSSPQNTFGYLNPALPPNMAYRSNQGESDYSAMTVVAKYRSAHGQLQASYTWSHSIDNQSDPLAGEFDLAQLHLGGSGLNGLAGFSEQFIASADRGNSDFDQRHNLVFYSTWELPAPLAHSRAGALFRNWRVSELAAVRSGLPYSIQASVPCSNCPTILNNRADIVNPGAARSDLAIAGGVQLLNPAAFLPPTPGTLGNSGRNAFSGPGLVNADVSLSRAIALPRLKERAKLVIRADAFNFVNHANLNNPAVTQTGASKFGQASFGRQEATTGFPLLTPLQESARQIQLLLRVEF